MRTVGWRPATTSLGFDQEEWLERQLWESKQRGSTWRVLGQQVMMAQLSTSYGQSIINPDQWDGYAPARARLLTHLRDNNIKNNVVLTGDIHSTWCADLTLNPWDSASYNPQTGKGVLGAEFVCPAVTSPGAAPNDAVSDVLSAQLRSVSPHLKYINLNRRGYGVLDLTREMATCEIYHVETIDAKSDQETLAKVMVSEVGNNLVRGEGEKTPRL